MCIIVERFLSFSHLLMENEGKTRFIGAFYYIFLFHSTEMWFGANFVKCLSSFIHAIGETFLLDIHTWVDVADSVKKWNYIMISLRSDILNRSMQIHDLVSSPEEKTILNSLSVE